jgi:hypothetical protein
METGKDLDLLMELMTNLILQSNNSNSETATHHKD